jgi:hypothetical protein
VFARGANVEREDAVVDDESDFDFERWGKGMESLERIGESVRVETIRAGLDLEVRPRFLGRLSRDRFRLHPLLILRY